MTAGLDAEAEEALRRGAVVWVALDGRPPRAVWHVWRDGAVLLVTGGDEQELPGADDARSAVVVVRGRGALAERVAELPTAVERLAPGTPDWDDAVTALVPERLNAADLDALPGRWAASSTVLRLRPA